MKGRKIEIYVDSRFLKAFFDKLNDCGKLSDDFEVYYSFYKIIQQDHVRIISLESGKEIKAADVIRVFQSMYGVEDLTFEQYQISDVSYLNIDNPQSLFLGEVYKDDQNELKRKYGFVFSCKENFVNNWSKLLLINKKSTIHVKLGFSWEAALKPYSLSSNAILMVEPYILSWGDSKLKYNVTDALNAITDYSLNNGASVKIITKDHSKEAKIENLTILAKLQNLPNVCVDAFQQGSLDDFIDKLGKQDKGQRKTSSEKKTKEANYFVKNLLHDRYIITNYHLIISTHSLDLVDDYKNVRKNTQLIIQPLIQSDYFEFYISKLNDYSTGLLWKNDNELRAYLISKSHGNSDNTHFYKPDSSKA